MADILPEDFPEEARNYLQTIDLQVASITQYNDLSNDYDHALADQIAQLQDLKQRIEADSSIACLTTPSKRAVDSDDVNPSTLVVRDRPVKRARRIRESECSTCLEDHPVKETATLKCCGTIYCKTCFQAWFDAALSTTQLPKCCDIGIEPKEYSGKLTKPLTDQYKLVVRQLESERKLWCANMNCRVFIKINQDASGFVQCKKCRRKTCATCAGSTSVHKGRRRMCPNHLTDEILESTIANNKWKRCPRCHVVVEKKGGCNNISCTCGTMFCFRCGTSKKSEAGACKCTSPRTRFVEPNEDPDSEGEIATDEA